MGGVVVKASDYQSSDYMEKTYKYGIVSTVIAMVLMLGIPAAVCTVFNLWSSPSLVLSVAGPLLALYLPIAVSEQLSMIPIAGTSCYLNSILGNVMNIKFPCYLNAVSTADASTGTEEADVIGMIAVTTSGMVTMIVVALGLLLLEPLKPLLAKEIVTTATSYILPALYGSMGISAFTGRSAGSYIAKRKPLVALIDLSLVFGFMFLIKPITAKETGYAMLIMLAVSIIVAVGLYKGNILKLQKK